MPNRISHLLEKQGVRIQFQKEFTVIIELNQKEVVNEKYS